MKNSVTPLKCMTSRFDVLWIILTEPTTLLQERQTRNQNLKFVQKGHRKHTLLLLKCFGYSWFGLVILIARDLVFFFVASFFLKVKFINFVVMKTFWFELIIANFLNYPLLFFFFWQLKKSWQFLIKLRPFLLGPFIGVYVLFYKSGVCFWDPLVELNR